MTTNTLHLLNDGTKLPYIGFGTYMLNGSQGAESITKAIHNGYRLIDGAFNYENEGAVGKAVADSGIARDKLWLTSKLSGKHHAYKEAIETIEESLYRTRVDYYDLYLIHWPNPNQDLYVEAWQALIEAKKRGLINTIGVCNFLPEHLERLYEETGVMPSVNQIELHPYFNQANQLAYHKKHHILTESWSPIGRGNEITLEPIIVEIAKAKQRTVTQIVLRWHIQHGAVPIPKARSEAHQRENLEVFDFELSTDEMMLIDSLTKEDGRLKNQHPLTFGDA